MADYTHSVTIVLDKLSQPFDQFAVESSAQLATIKIAVPFLAGEARSTPTGSPDLKSVNFSSRLDWLNWSSRRQPGFLSNHLDYHHPAVFCRV